MSSESEKFESAVLQKVFLQTLAGLFQDPVDVATMVPLFPIFFRRSLACLFQDPVNVATPK